MRLAVRPFWASVDILQQFITQYNLQFSPAFDFGNPLNLEQVSTASNAVFPDDLKSRSWLRNAIEVIHTLLQVTSSCPSGLQFSIMEALYSRGFTLSDSVKTLTQVEFASALAGSVAYPFAEDIFNAFVPTAPISNQASVELPLGFAPVSNGGLSDDIPSPNLSPFSGIAYLHEILAVRFGQSSLGDILAARRGPVSNILASPSNLGIQISCIDIVNESLEALGSGPNHAHGVFMNTNASSNGATPQDQLAAMPEQPSPTRSPIVYDTLKSCFSAASLPYSQSLNVCRTVLTSMRSSRFESMRHFRKDITELPIDARLEPENFQRNVWRYPVRFDMALGYLGISSEEYTNLFSGSLTDEEFLRSILGLDTEVWKTQGVSVSALLHLAGLKYKEFLELWRCRYVCFERTSASNATETNQGFPDHEPLRPKRAWNSFWPVWGRFSVQFAKVACFC
jgi:hypothetical protein